MVNFKIFWNILLLNVKENLYANRCGFQIFYWGVYKYAMKQFSCEINYLKFFFLNIWLQNFINLEKLLHTVIYSINGKFQSYFFDLKN